jgi:hypothetical protein
MGDKFEETIKKYYFDKNANDYLKKCNMILDVEEELSMLWNAHNIQFIKLSQKIWPSSKWLLKLPACIVGEFNVEYTTTLLISRLQPVYYLQHEFIVQNKDSNKISPTLEGFDSQPYTVIQQKIQDLINCLLEEKHYRKLTYSEINTVIHGLSFDDTVTIFGPQVTLEYALFYDLLDLCPD